MNLDSHLITQAKTEGEFRFQMGVRKLGDSPWLELHHRDFELQRNHRAELLETQHAELVGYLDRPEVLEASQELLEEIQLELEHHQIAQPELPKGLHPIDEAGRLVREDLLVHTPTDGQLVLSAGSLCFPTQWALHDKLGKPLAEIHAPVPTYEVQLQRPVDTFMAQMRPGPGVYRHNFSIVDDPKLCLLPQPRKVVNNIEGLWLRGERQTLRKLDRSGAIVFTVGIDVEPITALAAPDRRPAALALLKIVETMPLNISRYKGLAGPDRRDCLLDWLRRII